MYEGKHFLRGLHSSEISLSLTRKYFRGGWEEGHPFSPSFSFDQEKSFLSEHSSKVGFKKYPSGPSGNEKAIANSSEQADLPRLRLLQVLSFFILMKHGAIMQVDLLLPAELSALYWNGSLFEVMQCRNTSIYSQQIMS